MRANDRRLTQALLIMSGAIMASSVVFAEARAHDATRTATTPPWTYDALCCQGTGFQAFMADMGPRPDGLTLDRIDPFEPYQPDNCRWASWAEQAQNKREHRLSPFELAALRKQRSDARRGEKSTQAKLTDAMVLEIKKLIRAGARTGDLAEQFNVAPQTICGIKAGRNWTHVEAA